MQKQFWPRLKLSDTFFKICLQVKTSLNSKTHKAYLLNRRKIPHYIVHFFIPSLKCMCVKGIADVKCTMFVWRQDF